MIWFHIWLITIWTWILKALTLKADDLICRFGKPDPRNKQLVEKLRQDLDKIDYKWIWDFILHLFVTSLLNCRKIKKSMRFSESSYYSHHYLRVRRNKKKEETRTNCFGKVHEIESLSWKLVKQLGAGTTEEMTGVTQCEDKKLWKEISLEGEQIVVGTEIFTIGRVHPRGPCKPKQIKMNLCGVVDSWWNLVNRGG